MDGGFFKLGIYGHRLDIFKQENVDYSVPFECVRPGSGEETQLGFRLPPSLHFAVPIHYAELCDE